MEFDQPGEEELEAAGGGVKDNVIIINSDEMSDLRPEQQIQNEEETRTPHVGSHREWKANNLVDLGIG